MAKLDEGRVHSVFKVGDCVLLRTKDLLDTVDIGRLRPGPAPGRTLHIYSLPEPQRLALPRKMRCSPTVDRLRALLRSRGRAAPPGPPAVSDAGQAGEHEVARDLLLNPAPGGAGDHRVPCPLAGPRLAGRSPRRAWRLVEELDNCRDLVAEYEAIVRNLNRRAARSAASARRAFPQVRDPGPGPGTAPPRAIMSVA